MVDNRNDEANADVESLARVAILEAIALLRSCRWESPKAAPADPVRFAQFLVSAIDELLSRQVDTILHQPDFQRLEGTWRALYLLAAEVTDRRWVQLVAMHLTEPELREIFTENQAVGQPQCQASFVPRMIWQQAQREIPIGCLVCDTYFGQSDEDVECLRSIAKCVSEIPCPFIAGVLPPVDEFSGWQDVTDPSQLSDVLSSPAYEEWWSLRKTEISKYVCLCAPRFLTREPYGGRITQAFSYTESCGDANPRNFAWANAAFLQAVTIIRCFECEGWFGHISGLESGGAIEGLPAHRFLELAGKQLVDSPTEVSVNQDARFALLGINMICHKFIERHWVWPMGDVTLRYPPELAVQGFDPAYRLRNVLLQCHFVHVLQALARDLGIRSPEQLQNDLQRWIDRYVGGEWTQGKPLENAKIALTSDPDDSASLIGEFFIWPRYATCEPVPIVMRFGFE